MRLLTVVSPIRCLLLLSLCLLLIGCGKETERQLAQSKDKVGELVKENTYLKTSLESMKSMEVALESANEELKSAEKAMEEMMKREQLAKARLDIIKGILDKLKIAIESGDLKVRVKRGKMVLELPSAVLFESGKADLSEKGMKTLETVATVLKEIKDREFQVAGHTDNVKVSEDNPYGDNWHLSTARAISVVLHLKEQGVSPKNLSAAGYAQYRPVASNKGKRGKRRNRRIEITLMPNLKELPDMSDLEKEFGLAEE